MIGDNPAARLLAVLEAGQQKNQNMSCREAWQQILGVEKGRDALLMSRLGKVMELPEQAIQILNRDFPNQTTTFHHWNAKVNHAFSQQNLNAEWKSFQGHIDTHTLSYLRLTADLVQTKMPTKLLAAETTGELRSQVDRLLVEVLEGDFENEIKEYVARYLRHLIIALDEYHISGALPVIETVEGAFGHAFFDDKYREAISGTPIGQEVVNVLSAVASAVTIALGAPQLPNAIQLMLEKFK